MKFHPVHKNSQKGFTLIELLVVISIISLLSSIVLGSLKSAKDKATVTKIVQEVRQFKQVMELYRANNPKYFVNAAGGDPFIRITDTAKFNAFVSAMAPYGKIDKFSFITTASNIHYVDSAGASYYGSGAIDACGGVIVKPNSYLIFFYNPLLTNEFKRWDSDGAYSCVVGD